MDVNSVYSATATYAAYESAEVKKSAKTEEAKDLLDLWIDTNNTTETDNEGNFSLSWNIE